MIIIMYSGISLAQHSGDQNKRKFRNTLYYTIDYTSVQGPQTPVDLVKHHLTTGTVDLKESPLYNYVYLYFFLFLNLQQMQTMHTQTAATVISSRPPPAPIMMNISL